MDDLISRKALLEHIKSLTGMFTDELGFAVSMDAVLRNIEHFPAVEAEPVKHGNWIDDFKCSNCNKMFLAGVRHWNYCPNCGAKMDGKDTNVPSNSEIDFDYEAED